MSIKEYNTKLIISDAMTGEIIITLPCRTITLETIKDIVKDILEVDLINKHGLMIKYGIEP